MSVLVDAIICFSSGFAGIYLSPIVKKKKKVSKAIDFKSYGTEQVPVIDFSKPSKVDNVMCPHCHLADYYGESSLKFCSCDEYPFNHFHFSCQNTVRQGNTYGCHGKFVMIAASSKE